jgi:hypothetical protein
LLVSRHFQKIENLLPKLRDQNSTKKKNNIKRADLIKIAIIRIFIIKLLPLQDFQKNERVE